MRSLTSLICRILFVVAFVLAGLAIGEKLANLAGYTLLRGALGPGRMLEIAAMSPLFVVALLLRNIEHALRSKGTT